MHINVKNIILWQLIAQYFNLIISENRKNVVKSFPVRVFVPFTHPHPRLKCTSSAGLRSVIVVDKGGNRVMAVTPMKLLLFIRIAFPTSSAKRRRTFWTTTRNVLVYVAHSHKWWCGGAEHSSWHTYIPQLDNFPPQWGRIEIIICPTNHATFLRVVGEDDV